MALRRRRRAPTPVIDVGALAHRHLEAGQPLGWFDELYEAAQGHAEAVPWAGLQPHPYVIDWLDDPVTPVPGKRAVVVGCGLGDDAALLADAGYEVTAFDVSPAAVAWAKDRFPDAGIDWQVVDLLSVPEQMVGAFDLLVEVRTVQSLPGVVRDAAMHAIASLVAPTGVAIVVTLMVTDAQLARNWPGPPWAQVPSELAAYRAGGLERVALEHPDPDPDGSMEVRVTWTRPEGSVPGDPPGTGAGFGSGAGAGGFDVFG